MAAAPALQERVNRLEDAVSEGLTRIENLIRQEIRELKTEQLADIKQTIDRVERDLKGEHERLADDQRRLWDRLTSLEKDNNERTGGAQKLQLLWLSLSSTFGGVVGAAVNKWWH